MDGYNFIWLVFFFHLWVDSAMVGEGVIRNRDVSPYIVTRWHCWSMFGLPVDLKSRIDVCSARQHVLLGNMFSQHLFLLFLLLCLSPFYLSLFNPSVSVLWLCVWLCACMGSVCVCVCEWWLRVKHLTLSKRKMMKTRVKSPTFIKVRPEMTNTPDHSGWCHTC